MSNTRRQEVVTEDLLSRWAYRKQGFLVGVPAGVVLAYGLLYVVARLLAGG